MTVDLCTKSCKEIGQPLAALNYGTVGDLILACTGLADNSSVLVVPSGMAVCNYHPSLAVNLVLETLLNDAEDGQVNLASTVPMLGTTLLRPKVIWDVGRRPHQKQSKALGNG